MTVKGLLVLIAIVVSSVVLVPSRVVADAHVDSPSSTVEEDVDQGPSLPERRRRESGQQGSSHLVHGGVDGDGRQGWTVRRRVSTGSASNVSDTSSSTESRLTADQWRRRERSVTTSSVLSTNSIISSCCGFHNKSK